MLAPGTIYLPVKKGYLLEIIESLPPSFFEQVKSPSSNDFVNIFSEDLCATVSLAVTDLLGLSSDVYVESEVICPVLGMFVGSALDVQTIAIMASESALEYKYHFSKSKCTCNNRKV